MTAGARTADARTEDARTEDPVTEDPVTEDGVTEYGVGAGWKPFREPLRVTALRTGAIAMAIGAVLAGFRGGVRGWPMATLLALWPAFGGHWVEVWYLNGLRPRLRGGRRAQVAARMGLWFATGVAIAFAMRLTSEAAGLQPLRWLAWRVGGAAFIGIELAAHLVLQMRGLPSFYNGRG